MAETLNLNINASITCHAWNKDRTQIALSPNSKDVLIYAKNGANWTLTQTLSQHSSKVLAIDWAPQTDRIVTCGADKNAYVWSLDGRVWKPELVVLRINRAATCIKWSPNEKKFAVGCGYRCICVCFYEKDQCFWVSKHIKKPIRSTTLCIDWHPNSALIAAGGSDYKCRIFGAYVKEVDGAAPPPTVWGARQEPPECIAEYSTLNRGWVHSCAFNLTGNVLGFVGHDSTLYMVDASKNPQEVLSIRTPFLPFLSIKFVSDSTVIAAGHDCFPIVYALTGNSINQVEKLEVSAVKQTAGATSAMDRFVQMDRARNEHSSSSSSLLQNSSNSIHQNSIKQINIFSQAGAASKKLTQFSTCGLDGLVVVWDLNALEKQFSNLRIN